METDNNSASLGADVVRRIRVLIRSLCRQTGLTLGEVIGALGANDDALFSESRMSRSGHGMRIAKALSQESIASLAKLADWPPREIEDCWTREIRMLAVGTPDFDRQALGIPGLERPADADSLMGLVENAIRLYDTHVLSNEAAGKLTAWLAAIECSPQELWDRSVASLLCGIGWRLNVFASFKGISSAPNGKLIPLLKVDPASVPFHPDAAIEYCRYLNSAAIRKRHSCPAVPFPSASDLSAISKMHLRAFEIVSALPGRGPEERIVAQKELAAQALRDLSFPLVLLSISRDMSSAYDEAVSRIEQSSFLLDNGTRAPEVHEDSWLLTNATLVKVLVVGGRLKEAGRTLRRMEKSRCRKISDEVTSSTEMAELMLLAARIGDIRPKRRMFAISLAESLHEGLSRYKSRHAAFSDRVSRADAVQGMLERGDFANLWVPFVR
jgi:hypothetical protein